MDRGELFSFWKQIGDAYFKCVLDFEANAKGASAIKPLLPLVIAGEGACATRHL